PTPARGAVVTGRVIDPLGHPVRDAIVKLNDYQTRTDEQGRYAFRHVPGGSYEISLERGSLPADYEAGDLGRRLTPNGRSRAQVDFRVIPLNTITGRVYCDKNGNGVCDAGEGVPGAVLHLNGHATSTDEEGVFTFYNNEPGQYTIRLDIDRLPTSYAPAS